MHYPLSPTVMGKINRNTVAKWIYRWGFSSDHVVTRLLDKEATGWAARAVQTKWLRATKTASGYPRHLYTLAPAGLELASGLADALLDYPEQDPISINQSTLRHELMTQLFIIDLYRQDQILDYWSPREWACPSDTKLKSPDAVVELRDGRRIGIEMELSAKFGRRLDEFVGDTIFTMSENAGEYQLDGFWIVSDVPALLERYRAAFSIGAPWRTWKKNQRGYWVEDELFYVIEEDLPELQFLRFSSDRI